MTNAKKFKNVINHLRFRRDELRRKVQLAPIGEMTKKYYKERLSEVNQAIKKLKS